LLPILGFSSARVEAHAISIGKKRELVIVQDISNSFCDVFDAARTADRLLVQRMAAQSVFGDSVGVVTFGDGVTTEQDLTPLDGRSGEVISAINSMSCAPEWTNTGAGIRRATELFEDSDPAETERVIILVTDGVPNRSPGNPAALAAMQSAAIDAATAAGDEGIHIFGVHLTSSAGDALRNEIRKIQDLISAADGMGTYHQTPDPDDLDEILLTILGGLPIHLAE
jgi:Mg-chelatase subunit ChlD